MHLIMSWLAKIVEISKRYVMFILFFFSTYKSKTANRAEKAAWNWIIRNISKICQFDTLANQNMMRYIQHKCLILSVLLIQPVTKTQIPIPNFFVLGFCCCHNSNLNSRRLKINMNSNFHMVLSKKWLKLLIELCR